MHMVFISPLLKKYHINNKNKPDKSETLCNYLKKKNCMLDPGLKI